MTGKELICQAPDPFPGMPDDAISLEVARISGMIAQESGVEMLPALPGPKLRARLEARRIEIHRAIRPIAESMAERDRAEKVIAILMLGFLGARKDVDFESMIPAYVTHLSDLPLFAIEKACEDAIRRRPRDMKPDFAPSSARLHDMAKAHVEPLAAERYQIARILGVKKLLPSPMDPERAKVIKEKLEGLAETLAGPLKDERAARASPALRELARTDELHMLQEYERLGTEPVISGGLLISPAILQKMSGRQPKRGKRA